MTQITLMALLDSNKRAVSNYPSDVATTLNKGARFYTKGEHTILSSHIGLPEAPSSPHAASMAVFREKTSLKDRSASLVKNLKRAEEATATLRIKISVPLLDISEDATPPLAVKLRALFKDVIQEIRVARDFPSDPNVNTSDPDFRGWKEVRVASQAEMYALKSQLEEAIQNIQTQLTITNVECRVAM